MKPELQCYEVPRSKAGGGSWGIDSVRIKSITPSYMWLWARVMLKSQNAKINVKKL